MSMRWKYIFAAILNQLFVLLFFAPLIITRVGLAAIGDAQQPVELQWERLQ
jgi:hypothetical protein